jgi:Cohesin loading factor
VVRKNIPPNVPQYHSPNLNTTPPQLNAIPPKPTIASPKPHIAPPKPKPAPKPEVVYDGPKISYDLLLLALSDEYIEAAYKLAPTVATAGDDTKSETFETYYNLIAAGLSCLEATLKVSYSVTRCFKYFINELLEFQVSPENGSCYNIEICIYNVR